jgi:hypothetical protein
MSSAELEKIMKKIDNCEHEIDFNGWVEPGDLDDIARFKQACFWMRCKHCGCKGLCVDDTGDFWLNPETGVLE